MGGGPTAAGPCGRGRARPPAGPGGVRRGSTHSRTPAPRTGPCPSPPRASVPSLVTPMWGWPGGGGPVPLSNSQPRDTGSRAVWPTVRAHVLRTTNRDSAFGPETPTRGPQGLSLGARGLSTWGRSFCPAKDTEILCLTPWGGGSGDRGRGTGTGGTHLCGLQRELRACRSPTARHGACTPFLSPSTRGRANAASTLTRRASQSDGGPLGPGWEVPLHTA